MAKPLKGFAAKRGPRALDSWRPIKARKVGEESAKRTDSDSPLEGVTPYVSLCRLDIPVAEKYRIFEEGILCDDSVVVSLNCRYKYVHDMPSTVDKSSNVDSPPQASKTSKKVDLNSTNSMEGSEKDDSLTSSTSDQSDDSFYEEELVKEVDDALNKLIEDICEEKSPDNTSKEIHSKTLKPIQRTERKHLSSSMTPTPSRLSKRIMMKKDKFDARVLLKGADLRKSKSMSRKVKDVNKKPQPQPYTTNVIVKLNEDTEVTVEKVPARKVSEEDKKRLLSALNDGSDEETELSLKDEIKRTGTPEGDDKVDDSDIYKELEQVVHEKAEMDTSVNLPRKRRRKGSLKVRFHSIHTKKGRPPSIPARRGRPPKISKITNSLDGDSQVVTKAGLTEDQIKQLIIKRKSLSDSELQSDSMNASSATEETAPLPIKPTILGKKRGRPRKVLQVQKEQEDFNGNAVDGLFLNGDITGEDYLNGPKGNYSKIPFPRERKTAMVPPMIPAKEYAVKRTGRRPLGNRTQDHFSVKSPLQPDDFLEDPFERYFTVEERIIEHNDSFDSDVSDDKELLSHFIVTKKLDGEKASDLRRDEGKMTSKTIYDLMSDISIELPSWNLHVLPDSNTFCLAKVTRGPLGIPSMKKTIELDADFNAKVYVNQTFQSELRGVYDSYETIKELIYIVDSL